MEYEKCHDSWSVLKKIIDSREPVLSFMEGEIWWCNIGVNVGSEIDGKGDQFTRLVAVVMKTSSTVFYALPLSSQKATFYYHMPLKCDGKISYAVLSQGFACSSKRLERRFGTLSKEELIKLRVGWIDVIRKAPLTNDESPD
jgi:mRNA interferase MazF